MSCRRTGRWAWLPCCSVSCTARQVHITQYSSSAQHVSTSRAGQDWNPHEFPDRNEAYWIGVRGNTSDVYADCFIDRAACRSK